jgi:type IV pilus assembly protein PilE
MLRFRPAGFSLIELLVAIVIISILASIAYPSYLSYVREGRRSEALTNLMNMQLQQEKWRANHNTYATLAELGTPASSDHYAFSVTLNDATKATQYSLEATAQGDQANDKEGATTCSPLTLNQSNTKTPNACWQK